MPYLLNMDRAQVLAWMPDKFFHLAGVFASFLGHRRAQALASCQQFKYHGDSDVA